MASYDFRIIRPVEVTDAILTSSNVPETVAATYAGGTTYSLGDRVGLAPVDGAAQLIYESLSAGNVGNALPVPPATSTAFWRYVASVYPAYSGAVTYALDDIVSSISTDSHLRYQSLAAGNVGNALTDITKWVHYGSPKVTTGAPYNSTNRWKMFDQSYGSQTENAESISLVLTPGVLVTDIAFLNAEGQSIRVQQSVSGYDETISLQSHGVDNWYDWYYEELLTEDEAYFENIPPYAASTLTITIAATEGTAKCGVCVIGKSRALGWTQWGMSKEIQNYSRVVENKFGDFEMRRGAIAERLNLDVHLTPGSEGEVFSQMKTHSSEPLVIIGSTDFSLSIMYGFIEAWQVPCELTGGLMPVRVRGLV
jgi:hypothetical protein